MMATVLSDLLDLPKVVEQDSAFSLLVRERSLPKAFSVTVEEGRSLEMTVVDLSSLDEETTLSVRLKRGSVFRLSFASLLPAGFSKRLTVDVHHDEPDSYSRVSFVGIDYSTKPFAFLGNSYIPKGAVRSDTRQEGRITNLNARCDSAVSPALFIKENDVKASHGAALGAYDPNQVYYLMSRGLSESESKKLITTGYLLPIIEKLGDDNLIKTCKDALEGLHL